VPDSVGGSLTVASFNVLNYFTTLDGSGSNCGPEADEGCRGADNATEFTRQRDKIISAIVTMDANIVGLMEIENHETDDALKDLVNGLNAAGAGTYAAINTGTIGDDAIKVGLIYQPDSVTPYGDFAVLDSAVDSTFNDTRNRPVLAQTWAMGKVTVT
jgi:predicted extracellular nuclease